LKISLVTVVYNAQDTIGNCIESVISQNYNDVEHVIIDGGSTDNTLQIINQYRSHIKCLISESDHGIYDAMNKGIRQTSGQIVGMLNADDYFADNEVLQAVAKVFTQQQQIDVVYGDLDVINPLGKVIRKWRSGQCRINSFTRGFMPPHPTFYCKRNLFEKLGYYSLEYGSAGDYELMARFMHLHKIRSFYINKIMVKMRVGGVSSQSFKNRLKAWQFDLKAMRKNQIPFPYFTLMLKPLRKVLQFI
jgi:glycosyltransferase involved in cell wall biosynthesis